MRRHFDPEFVAGIAALMLIGANRTAKQAVTLAREVIAEVEATQPKEPEDGE